MADTDVFGFLGLREDWDVHPDVAIMQIPLEMTVSYGTGCYQASNLDGFVDGMCLIAPSAGPKSVALAKVGHM